MAPINIFFFKLAMGQMTHDLQRLIYMTLQSSSALASFSVTFWGYYDFMIHPYCSHQPDLQQQQTAVSNKRKF